MSELKREKYFITQRGMKCLNTIYKRVTGHVVEDYWHVMYMHQHPPPWQETDTWEKRKNKGRKKKGTKEEMTLQTFSTPHRNKTRNLVVKNVKPILQKLARSEK